MTIDSVLTSEIFWDILKESGSINETRGMLLHELRSGSALLRTFSKNHSYGEYIFDWSWARAYEDNGVPYYPKLSSMVPFTPARAPHFLGPQSEWSSLLEKHESLRERHSSAHFLFTTPEENEFLEANNYLIRDSFQYHFFNENYRDFDDFLGKLKGKKAKHIRNERTYENLQIERLTGSKLTATHAHEMHTFYLQTLEEKGAIPYLTAEFFRLLFERLPENTLYVRAVENDAPVAGALFYYDRERIYGRYWGARTFVPNLHFELCYYQGIEFCIERSLQVFEAGAQGEHKIARGFRPVLTTSAHRLNHPGFTRAIADFIRQERIDVRYTMETLSRHLPFLRS